MFALFLISLFLYVCHLKVRMCGKVYKLLWSFLISLNSASCHLAPVLKFVTSLKVTVTEMQPKSEDSRSCRSHDRGCTGVCKLSSNMCLLLVLYTVYSSCLLLIPAVLLFIFYSCTVGVEHPQYCCTCTMTKKFCCTRVFNLSM